MSLKLAKLRVLSKALQSSSPLLQVALDFTSIKKMKALVKKIYDLPIGVFEVGTPLIKAEGIRSISALRKLIGKEKLILADMKTADVGSLEVELAFRGGADAATVLASSNNEVIRSAIQQGEKLGVDIIVDTVGLINLQKRLEELSRIGVRAVNLHVGIDVQKAKGLRASDIAEKYLDLLKKFDLIYSISGGIRPSDVKRLSEYGFKIIVVGSSITKSQKPREVVKEILKAIGSF